MPQDPVQSMAYTGRMFELLAIWESLGDDVAERDCRCEMDRWGIVHAKDVVCLVLTNKTGFAGRLSSTQASFCFDCERQVLYGFVAATELDREEWRVAVGKSAEATMNPAALALLIMEKETFWPQGALTRQWHDINRIGRNLQMAPTESQTESQSRPRNHDPEGSNNSNVRPAYESEARRLTGASRKISRIKSQIVSRETWATITKQFLEGHDAICASKQQSVQAKVISDGLEERLSLTQARLESLSVHASSLFEETQALVQTLYCLVGTVDNELNRQIAEAARRDSKDMRIIAYVTLLFLPGTFVAVRVHLNTPCKGLADIRGRPSSV